MIRIRPIALVVAAVVLGILVAPVLPLAPLFCYLLAAIMVIGSVWLAPLPVRSVVLALAFVLIGTGRMREVSLPAPGDISCYADGPSVWVQGRVASLVEGTSSGGYSFTLAATTINDFHTLRPTSGAVHVTLRRGIVIPEADETLWLRGRIETTQVATNPGAFDYADYSARHGAFCRMTIRYPEDAHIVQKPGVSILSIAQKIRRGAQAQTAKYLRPDDAALLDGLLLSARTHLSATLDDAFQRTGTVHILSVSGLHMTAFAGVLVFLFRYLLLPRPVANLLSIILIWLFALAAGASAAPLRAAIMATVFLAAPLLRRTAEPLHALGFAALLLLFADPGSLFDAGFQLSFASVGGLLLFMEPLSERLLPMRYGQTRVQQFSHRVLQLILVGFVAEAVTAPLVAYHFNQWSLVSPFANVLITVWSEFVLLGGLGLALLSLLTGGILPWMLPLLWLPMAWALWLLRFLTMAFAALPFSALSVPSPPVWSLMVYYALLGGAALYVRRRFSPTSPLSSAAASPASVLQAETPTAASSHHLS